MSSTPISSSLGFIQSLTPEQRAWYLAEQADRETHLQRTLVDLGRALSGVAAAHGEVVHLQQSAASQGGTPLLEGAYGR